LKTLFVQGGRFTRPFILFFPWWQGFHSVRLITSPTGKTKLQTASFVFESLKQRSAILAGAGAGAE
jgi:hypothetical protein